VTGATDTTTTTRSANPTVGRSSAVMALGTLGSRLTGAIRTVVLASFGLGALTDTYNQANTTPNMVYELVAGGVLSATLVPLFTQLLRRDTRRSRDGVNAIVSLFAVVVVVASVALALAAPLILRLPYVLTIRSCLSEPGCFACLPPRSPATASSRLPQHFSIFGGASSRRWRLRY
jgi:hypothetical protein